MTEAVLGGATPEELERCPAPTTTRGLCVRKSEEKIFEGLAPSEIDVRKSLHFDEVPLPELAPDEVLVAVMASALNYNTVWTSMFLPVSTFRFLERFGRQGPEGARHDLDRHVLGSDAAGVIVRRGPGVRHYGVGDHVVITTLYSDDQEPIAQWDGMLVSDQRAWGFETNFGGLAHYTVVKANQLLPKPGYLTWEEAASTTLCLMTAYRMLISSNGACVKVGDIVLVWGAVGGLGAFGVQLARAAGCRVAGVVGDSHKAELARSLGCDHVIDRNELGDLTTPKGWRALGQALRDAFGEDPHHVFEHVGRATFGASVYVARRGGTVVTCGSSAGYQHEFDNRHLWMKLKRIIGSHGANYQEAWEAHQLLSRGTILPTMSEVVRLENATDAVRRMHRNEHVGKVSVLSLAPEEGLGVSDPQLRDRVPDERLHLFRRARER